MSKSQCMYIRKHCCHLKERKTIYIHSSQEIIKELQHSTNNLIFFVYNDLSVNKESLEGDFHQNVKWSMWKIFRRLAFIRALKLFSTVSM